MISHHFSNKYFVIRFLALMILILVIVLNALGLLARNMSNLVKSRFDIYSHDPISLLEQKLGPIKDSLSDLNYMGYVDDESINSTDRVMLYYIAQYSLSPIIVVRSTDNLLLLGYFPSGLKDNPSFMNYFYIHRDYSNGYYLFKRNVSP